MSINRSRLPPAPPKRLACSLVLLQCSALRPMQAFGPMTARQLAGWAQPHADVSCKGALQVCAPAAAVAGAQFSASYRARRAGRARATALQSAVPCDS